MAVRRTARIRAGALEGIDGIGVTAEIDISRGLPGFHLVGLPSAEVRESRERVLSALRNSGRKAPLGKITVNLAPASLRKTGASCDLAIALGVLAAGRAIKLGPAARMGATFLGELSLFGEVRAVAGLLSLVIEAAKAGNRMVVVPAEQLSEAALVSGIEVVGVKSLAQAIHWWEGGALPSGLSTVLTPSEQEHQEPAALWGNLAGQPLVGKGAMIVAAGGHHCLMVGPPGTGKTRLARLLARVGPPLSVAAALDVTRIHSAVGSGQFGWQPGVRAGRPFRAPHHSISRAGLIGGGSALRPGEVTLAHEGILFLDEISEFAPAVLDGLREPLDDGYVTVARGVGVRVYPARFQLIAAMNPCRCGFLGSSIKTCTCKPADLARHRSRLSGPLLDRIDLFLEVGDWQGDYLTRSSGAGTQNPAGDGWRDNPRGEDIRRARARLQILRQEPLEQGLSGAAARLLDDVRQPLGLSLRGVERCVAVAATVAALDDVDLIGEKQVREALEFRQGVLFG